MAVVESKRLPWYFSGSFLVLTFLTLPPVVLPLVWLHPKLHWLVKVLVSLAVVAVTWITVEAMIRFAQQIDEVSKMWETSPF